MKTPAAWLTPLAAGALLFQATAATARYEYARALGTRCSACHDGHHPDIETLNAAGRYYLANRTLDARARSALPAAAVFERNCAPCHGAAGEGTPKARPLSPAQKAASPAQIEAAVRNGIPGTGMFGFGAVLTAAEIRAVTSHVQTLRTR